MSCRPQKPLRKLRSFHLISATPVWQLHSSLLGPAFSGHDPHGGRDLPYHVPVFTFPLHERPVSIPSVQEPLGPVWAGLARWCLAVGEAWGLGGTENPKGGRRRATSVYPFPRLFAWDAVQSKLTIKLTASGPSQVVQLSRASSLCTKVVSSILVRAHTRISGTTNRCLSPSLSQINKIILKE